LLKEQKIVADGQLIVLYRSRKRIVLSALLIALVAVVTSCSTKPLKDPIIGPEYQVRNVYRQEHLLPVNIRRVAVLPLSIKTPSAGLVTGKESLERIYHAELTKAARFETILIEPTQLKQWLGRETLDSYEDLPAQLFRVLVEKTGAEGVLFAHLSEYKAYPPILIGWRMKLVSNEAETIWAVEEMFDASEEAVSNSARMYDRASVKNNPVLEDSRSILLSPTRFGQYTLRAVLETLPVR
jgi:hypothetical protein